MKDTLEVVIKNLVENKEEVTIHELEGEKSVVYEVKVEQQDMGKVIGKQGRVAKAIRTLMKAIAAKEQKRVTIEFIGSIKEFSCKNI